MNIDKNPLQKLKLRIPENNPAYISVDELQNILDHEHDLIFKSLFEVAFYTGMRLSEITNLEWSNINLERREIRLINKTNFMTKSKKERVIPMADRVYQIINLLPKDQGYIFTMNGSQIKKNYCSKRFKKRVRDAKLPEGIHFHSLRHSFASNLVQKKVNLFHVQKLLGQYQQPKSIHI